MSANHNHGDNADKNIAVAFFLNLSFAVIELAGGLITNSVAILTDAFHELGYDFSFAVSWYLQKISKRPRDSKYTYGYKRFSLLGSVVISAVLTFGSLIKITESVKRMITPEKTDAKGMLYLPLLGIAINGIAALRMQRGNLLNEQAVFLQETPVGKDIDKITEAIGKIFGVKSILDLHIWNLDGQSHIMTLHAVIFEGTNAIPIQSAIKETSHIFGIDHTTVEIETELELCAAELEHNLEGEKHDH